MDTKPLGEEMLETLLESKSKRQGSTAGAVVSVMTHTVLIAAALYARKVKQLVQMPFVFTIAR